MTYVPRRLREQRTPAVLVLNAPNITPEDAQRIKDEWFKRTRHTPIVLAGHSITYHPAQYPRRSR